MKKIDKIKGIIKSSVPYDLSGNAICFLKGDRKPSLTAGDSLLGRIQDQLKRWGWLYYALVRFFKPVWRSRQMNKKLTDLLTRHGPEAIVLNLGSGPRIFKNRRDIINIDIYGFNEVDMIADAGDIPLEDGTVDLILNTAMLEHVTNPETVVKEMHRILKPGGELLCYLPFVVPFHAAPYDYYRWTESGARFLFSAFDEVEVGIGAGPTSGMLWVMQEWLAMILSFGKKGLHNIIFLVFMIISMPIKILDTILVFHPCADKIASGFYVSAKKRVMQ